MTSTPPPPEPIPEDDLLGGTPPISGELPVIPTRPLAGPPSTMAELVALLRLVNVHVQDLWSRLDLVRSGAASLDRSAGLIATTVTALDPLMDALSATPFPSQADSLARITNAWRALTASPVLAPPSNAPLDAQGQLKEIALVEGECRTIIYWTAFLTAGSRLEEWLATLRPGYAIPFHDIFRDEVPFAEERQRLLQVLAATPKLLAGSGGLIDGESGIVYRYEVDDRKRWAAVGWVVVALFAATFVVVLVGLYTPLAGSSGAPALLLGWGAALAGVVVHLGVTAAKRLRAGGASAVVFPVDRLSIDVSARLGAILLRIAMLLFAYVGLVAGGLVAANSGGSSNFLFSALLAGYSLDSVVDLLSARFDQQSAAQINGLKSQLAP